jgi:hypothetical protein
MTTTAQVGYSRCWGICCSFLENPSRTINVLSYFFQAHQLMCVEVHRGFVLERCPAELSSLTAVRRSERERNKRSLNKPLR